ncbi:hypothetical protein BH24CHL7_BH24CHL7_00900 [soil metagenome]|jgi:hypothetical protein
MSQVERGGQNVLRWPAELPETDNPEGSVGEEARDRDEQSERMAALPEHEQDPDEAVGGGMLASGGTAVEHGSSDDRLLGSDEGSEGESGLPMGDTSER